MEMHAVDPATIVVWRWQSLVGCVVAAVASTVAATVLGGGGWFLLAAAVVIGALVLGWTWPALAVSAPALCGG